MRVDVSPHEVTLIPGLPQRFTVTITNTETVIAGYLVRVLGADPGWVELDAGEISLFPDESREVEITVNPPKGITAGSRRVAVQVRELTPPYASQVAEIDLTVPPAPSMRLRADPTVITAGKKTSYGLLIENTGNTMITGLLAGGDKENQARFEFEPERVALSPGQHAVADMRVSAKRHVVGSPVVRSLSVFFDDLPDDAFFSRPADEEAAEPPSEQDRKALATVTFIQRAFMSRGALSLLGLLVAATVFAVVITVTLSKLVDQSAADRDLALEVAAARNAPTATGQSGVSGSARLLTSGKPAAGVTVSVFSTSNTSSPVATTATNSAGAYHVGGLAAGQYKISFRGAGFVELWYPGAASDTDATTITLSTGQNHGGLNVELGGVPAAVSGTVTGSDVSDATLFLETVPNGNAATGPTQAAEQTPNGPPDNGGAVVQQVPVGSDGTFSLADVPSPAVYDLVVTKPGFATTTQRIDVSAGENRTGVQLTLQTGDGLISGTVTSAQGPLSDVTISASSGQQNVNTVSLTGASAGTFTLRNLPTPGTFTLIARKAGFAPQTSTVSLSTGQKLTGVSITLNRSSASLDGVVLQLPDDTRAPGVKVTVTNGQTAVQTVTESTKDVGAWSVDGLPIPGTYTVTFSRSDLQSQIVSVSLDANGNIVPGTNGSQVGADGITVNMRLATASVSGTISQPGGPTVCNRRTNAAGEATVLLSSGSATFSVISASVAPHCGQYRITDLPPGTYTMTVSAGSGTAPSVRVLSLAAGDVITRDVSLAQPASVSGTVSCCATGKAADPGPRSGWTVFLYLASQYPNQLTATTTTDTSGAFSFDDILAGQYILAVAPSSDAADATTTVRVTVQPSQARTGVTIKVNQ